MIGRRFGRLVVLERVGRTPGRKILVRVRCDCGTEKVTQAASIRRGTRSCGCLQREAAAKVGRANRTETPKYHGAHKRLRRAIEKIECERCGASGPRLELAFRGEPGGYSTDPGDYEVLCSPCHRAADRERRSG